MADKRKGFKHGDFIKGDPNPHVDTYKYKDRQTGKITSHKVEGSEMKVPVIKKQQVGPGQPARRKSKGPKKTMGRQGAKKRSEIKIKVGEEGPANKHDKHLTLKLMKKGGRAGFQHGGRTNLLEELGRVEGESSNRNRRAEVSRIHGELNRGYKHGGSVGAAKRGFNKKILRS